MLEVKPYSKILPPLTLQVINLINQTKLDPDLKGATATIADTQVILVNGTPVGFFTPRRTSYKGKTYWRAGMTYIAPTHRRKGIAKLALSKFFCYRSGLVWIDDTNHASQQLFMSIGFKRTGRELTGGGWYIKPN